MKTQASLGRLVLTQRFCILPSSLRCLLLVIGICASALAPRVAPAASLVFSVFEGREFMQVGDFVFTTTPSRPAYWECAVRGLQSVEVDEILVTPPVGEPLTLTYKTGDDAATVAQDFMSAAPRSSMFPAGNYLLRLLHKDGSSEEALLRHTAPAAPEPPRFLRLLELQPSGGVDLRFDWDPGAGASLSDRYVLWVQGANVPKGTGWVFHTPWPGELGALSPLTTGVTVPGSRIGAGDILVVKLIRYRVAEQTPLPNGTALTGSATGVSTSLMVPNAPVGNDVTAHRLLLARVIRQDQPEPSASPDPVAFAFGATVWGASTERLTNVALAAPGGSPASLRPTPDRPLWEQQAEFATESTLAAACPYGTWRWTFEGTLDGRQSISVPLSPGPWPGTLAIVNWTEVQTNSFADDRVLRWTPPADTTPTDEMELLVTDSDSRVVFRHPNLAEGEIPIRSNAGSIAIPGGVLVDGEDYEGRLRLIRTVYENRTTLEGVRGQVARATEIRFPLGSRVAPPLTIPSISLSAAAVGEEYLAQLQAEGGREPLRWSLASGALPRGLRLEETGSILGTPYAGGDVALVVRVTDALGNSAVQAATLPVTGTLQPLDIQPTSLPTVADGVFCLLPLEPGGGVRPYRWSLADGRLPRGLELHRDAGLICGIAEEAGRFPIVVQVDDAAGQSQRRVLAVEVPSAADNPILRVTGLENLGGNRFRLGLNGVPDERVTVEYSTNLLSWNAFVTGALATDGTMDWEAPVGGPVFYRARRGNPEPQRNPVSIRIVPDPATVAVALLSPTGAVLSLRDTRGIGYRLEIPPNAVLQPVPVSMTVLAATEGLPFEIGFLAGVSFAPEGLRLLSAATLTLQFPGPVPEDITGFAFLGDGGDFHLYPSAASGNTLSVPVVHFSGVMAGLASPPNRDRMMSLNTACKSQSSAEGWIGVLARSDAGRETLWPHFYEWFESAVSPHLKAAAGNDELLWLATDEFLSFVNLLDRYILKDPALDDGIAQRAVTLRNKGWRMLARAFASAVNRSHARCVAEFRPFQAIRMMKLASAARALGLGRHLSQPDFFSEGRMLQRYQRAFRFEVEVFSRVDIRPDGGGRFTTRVRSEKCPIEARDYEDDSDAYELNLGLPRTLTSEYWRLVSPGDRISPVITPGQLIPVRLTLRPNYPEGPQDRCSQGTTWNDPADPEIVLVLDAQDPVQRMIVRTSLGPRTLPVGSSNWHELFKLFHGMQLADEMDAGGAVHKHSVRLEGEDVWEYQAKREFAKARFTGPPEYAQSLGGQADEETTVQLYHAPRALTGADTSVPE